MFLTAPKRRGQEGGPVQDCRGGGVGPPVTVPHHRPGWSVAGHRCCRSVGLPYPGGVVLDGVGGAGVPDLDAVNCAGGVGAEQVTGGLHVAVCHGHRPGAGRSADAALFDPGVDLVLTGLRGTLGADLFDDELNKVAVRIGEVIAKGLAD